MARRPVRRGSGRGHWQREGEAVTERADQVAVARTPGSAAGHGVTGNGSTKRAGKAELAGPAGVPLPATPALVCDRQGVVRQANIALAGLLGLGSADELLGVRVHRFLRGRDDDATLAWPDGGPVSRVRVQRYQLPTAAAGSDLVLVLVVDVTELQRAVRALAEERRRVADFERVAGLGYWE